MFDKVVVGVVNKPVRKEKTLFTAEERKQFIEDATADLGNVEVGIMSNLLVEFARENGATAVIKGLRAISDFEYEFEMNQLNRKLAPEIESMYIFASANYSFLSSTGVKEIATFGGDVGDLVPGPVAKALAERLRPLVASVRDRWAGACSPAKKRNPGRSRGPMRKIRGRP